MSDLIGLGPAGPDVPNPVPGHEPPADAHAAGPLDPGRRRVLELALRATLASITALVGVPVVGYAVSPALRSESANWIDIGPAGDLKPAQPVRLSYTTKVRDGWVEKEVRRAAWVVAAARGAPVVFSPACTHLGCAYRWNGQAKHFECPCHDAVFDIDGKVLAGPPPRPLDRYEAKVENGRLQIGRLLEGGKQA